MKKYIELSNGDKIFALKSYNDFNAFFALKGLVGVILPPLPFEDCGIRIFPPYFSKRGHKVCQNIMISYSAVEHYKDMSNIAYVTGIKYACNNAEDYLSLLIDIFGVESAKGIHMWNAHFEVEQPLQCMDDNLPF